MSVYFEKARELGTLILESEESMNLNEAGAAFDADENAKTKFMEYKEFHGSLQQKMTNGELNSDEVNTQSQILAEMAMELKRDPVIAGLIFAEDNFNNFVAQIMNVLKATISGMTEEGGCPSDGCSSCPGCSK